MKDKHPRDRFLTIYGRKPVLEALQTRGLTYGRLLVAQSARGEIVGHILALAKEGHVQIERCNESYVNRISRNAKQDQGVSLDVEPVNMMTLQEWLQVRRPSSQCVLLDGVTTPSNVGMLIRSALASGIDGIIMPRKGSPDITPLVIKASAGTAFAAPIVRVSTAAEGVAQLRDAGYEIFGLGADGVASLYDVKLGPKGAWVLGNETVGVSDSVRNAVNTWVRIPMAGEAESLNVACAGSIVMFEVQRRQMAKRAPMGA
jgi:23S rRNA (guanosine2251-2'-O)-methyltransferase